MLKLFSRLRNSEITRSTSILVSGTVLAQLIPLALQPVLRRYFEPEVFGAYSVYAGMLAILAVVTAFRYEQAIVLPESDADAANLTFAGIVIGFFFSIFLLFGIYIFKDEILKLINLKEEYSFFLFMLPLGVFLTGAYQSLNFWLLRKKAFKAISYNKFVRRAFEGSAQFIFAMQNKAFGLLWGDLIGNAANLGVFIKKAIKSGLNISWFSRDKTIYVLKKYAEFPKYSLLPALMAACSYTLPTILINKFYGQEATGFFDLSKMLLSVPMALGATALSGVVLQRYAEKFREKQPIYRELKTLFAIIIGLAFAEILFISLLGEELFAFLFGEKWRYAGYLSTILVWSYALNFVLSSFSSLFVSLGKVKWYSAWQVLYFVAIGLLILASNLSFETFLQVFVYVEMFSYCAIILLGVYMVYSYEKRAKPQNRYDG